MKYHRLLTIALPGFLLLGSCFQSAAPGSDYLAGIGGPVQRQTSGPTHPMPAIPDHESYWDGDGIAGPPLIKINRRLQKAYFYKGSTLVGLTPISSGKEDTGTPNGTYRITEKDVDHKSSAYGVIKDLASGQMINENADIRTDKVPPGGIFYAAPMPNFMRFNGGIGMHTGYLPGYAASHGCVRMPHHMSTKFFENVKVGTPVIVE
ncbi:MAG: L,D-transpeptidase family protein [Armatimonadetes bacterium]|nr:L,D-transpeptidase family protein [Akkermansiaceae bacterium]